MNRFRIAAMTVACIAMLGGCAARDTSATGTSVRATMASQIISPRPAGGKENGTDAAAAVAGYANYQRSYVTPAPAGDGVMIGSGISR